MNMTANLHSTSGIF